MPEGMFKKIIDELRGVNYRGKIYPSFYGEPLLDNRLASFIEYAHKTLPEARIVIYTNGDLLDKSKLEELYKAGAEYFIVTLHDNTRSNIGRIKEIIDYIKDKIEFDQLIDEKRGVTNWVHISFAPAMRQSVLTARFDKLGHATYKALT